MRLDVLLLCALAAAPLSASEPGTSLSHAGCAAPGDPVDPALLERPAALRSDIGSVHQPVTTASKEAQAFYDQGLTSPPPLRLDRGGALVPPGAARSTRLARCAGWAWRAPNRGSSGRTRRRRRDREGEALAPKVSAREQDVHRAARAADRGAGGAGFRGGG